MSSVAPPMKMYLLDFGTQGDLKPFLALYRPRTLRHTWNLDISWKDPGKNRQTQIQAGRRHLSEQLLLSQGIAENP